MSFRTIFIFLLLSSVGINGFSQQPLSQKSISQLIEELKSGDRDLSDSAIEELARRREDVSFLLLPIAADTDGDEFIRVRAIIVLGRIKDKKSIPTLINILSDKNSYINGASAYALSQIGGEKAKNALLHFLKKSLETNHGNLQRAVEAIKELPDSRAFPLLMKILEIAELQRKQPDSRNKEKDIVQNSTLRYAIEALGEIGDSRASAVIAKFLNPNGYYVDSIDYLCLRAIHKTKGEKAVPYLVSYLETIVEMLEGKEIPLEELGARNRQITYDFRLYKQTLDCLETITGQSSVGSTREEVLKFWKQYAAVNNQLFIV